MGAGAIRRRPRRRVQRSFEQRSAERKSTEQHGSNQPLHDSRFHFDEGFILQGDRETPKDQDSDACDERYYGDSPLNRVAGGDSNGCGRHQGTRRDDQVKQQKRYEEGCERAVFDGGFDSGVGFGCHVRHI